MRLVRREFSPVPEMILGAAEVSETPIPFEEPEAPRDGRSWFRGVRNGWDRAGKVAVLEAEDRDSGAWQGYPAD